MKKTMAKKGHVQYLDGMRGVAALWVVIYHTWTGGHIVNLAGAPPEAGLTEVDPALPFWITSWLFERGWMGVPVFFILSGFVIPLSQANRSDVSFKPLHFMHRRWRRLSPPYYAALALTIAVGLAEEQIRDVVFEMPSVGTIIAHLLYIQDLVDAPRIGVFFWTLAIEMQFCLMFALMKWVAGRMSWQYASDALLGIALVVSLPWALGWTYAGSDRGVFIASWFLFLAGQAIFESTRKDYWRWPTFAYVGVLAVAAFTNSGDERVAAGAVTALLLLLSVNVDNTPVERALSTRPALFLGRISYSLYLIHPSIAGAAFWMVYKVLDPSTATEFIALGLVTAAQIIGAMIWYQVFEKPSMQWSRQLRQPAPAHAE